MIHRFIRHSLLALSLISPGLAAETKYISDDIEVTLRSGMSSTNSIVNLLRSGDRVTVIEHDPATQYSLVETDKGKQGYVLTRFLMDQPHARDTLTDLQARYDTQQQDLSEQREEVERLSQLLTQATSDNENLKNTLRASEQELATVREATAETLDIIEQNERLQNAVAQLQMDKVQLEQENGELRDSTELDWLIRGGALVLVAFLVGILVTRIRWRKSDSWGSY